MNRCQLLSAGLLACGILAAGAQEKSVPVGTVTTELPTETDTVIVGRSVVLTSVHGEIFRKAEDGSLAPIVDGDAVRPGDVLLVRKSASFAIGNTTIGPEQHGDRWVKFE